jgi:hypothetical protein
MIRAIQYSRHHYAREASDYWMPAFAGMTGTSLGLFIDDHCFVGIEGEVGGHSLARAVTLCREQN